MTGIRLATLDDVTTLARFRVGLVDRAWIAMDAGEPVGTAGYRISGLLPRLGGAAFEARVHNVFVLEAYRNRGIGEALVRAALDEIGLQSFVRVTLGPSVRSQPFYERLGFRQGPDMRLEIDS